MKKKTEEKKETVGKIFFFFWTEKSVFKGLEKNERGIKAYAKRQQSLLCSSLLTYFIYF